VPRNPHLFDIGDLMLIRLEFVREAHALPPGTERNQKRQIGRSLKRLIGNQARDNPRPLPSRRKRFKQVSSLKDRLIQQAQRLRRQAKEMPPGVRRDEFLRKARQTETAAHLDDWLSSAGLQPPK
jgi:hypothetical protein